jgi:hypothetical protein
MPALALIYGVFICMMALESIYDNIKSREPAWFTALDAAADLAVLVMFIGYWASYVVQSIGWAAPCLFFACLLWRLCCIPYEIKGLGKILSAEDRQLYERHKSVIYGVITLLELPSYWFGGMAALGYYAHT